MKVLVADKFEKSGIEGLLGLGADVLYEPDLKDEALEKAIGESDAQVLIVRSTKVTAAMVSAGRLELIVRAGAGYNTIDVQAAAAAGVNVANCPGKNSVAVAELAFGLMIACDRHIPDNVAALRKGQWNKKAFSKARGLAGRTLGLVGLGNIGQEMVARARAFKMHVAACSRWLTPDLAEEVGVTFASDVDELAAISDFVSVHVALTPQTKGMVGKGFFEALRPGSVFINTSRAEVVDQMAMEAALKEKQIMVGLDVFEGEPSGGDGEYGGSLRDNEYVYCTHHIGASTDQAQEAVAAETVRIVKGFKESGVVHNAVRPPTGARPSHLIVVRYADRDGALGRVLNALKDADADVLEMETICYGSGKGIAQRATDREPSAEILTAVKRVDGVFNASAAEMPR